MYCMYLKFALIILYFVIFFKCSKMFPQRSNFLGLPPSPGKKGGISPKMFPKRAEGKPWYRKRFLGLYSHNCPEFCKAALILKNELFSCERQTDEEEEIFVTCATIFPTQIGNFQFSLFYQVGF